MEEKIEEKTENNVESGVTNGVTPHFLTQVEKTVLTPVKNREGLKERIKKNGVKYTVRDFRNRYFFPDEWNRFYDSINENKRFIFDVLINTGARIEEALCIKKEHIRWDRNYLTLYVTKIKAKKKETKPIPRDIIFSDKFKRKLKVITEQLHETDYIFLNNNKQYLTREELKKETKKKSVAISKLMKRGLSKAVIKNYWDFSLHNIRKTHGMWLKALDVKLEEICKRLGHDYNTYLKHYGSADIFNRQDKIEMIKILGEIYGVR